MSKWIACRAGIIAADVIRWSEPVWKPKLRRRVSPRKIGERLITAEVLSWNPHGWVRLKVTACETRNADDWLLAVPGLKPGMVVSRHAKTVLSGKVRRLAWSEEEARRSILAKPPRSRFLAEPSRSSP